MIDWPFSWQLGKVRKNWPPCRKKHKKQNYYTSLKLCTIFTGGVKGLMMKTIEKKKQLKNWRVNAQCVKPFFFFFFKFQDLLFLKWGTRQKGFISAPSSSCCRPIYQAGADTEWHYFFLFLWAGRSCWLYFNGRGKTAQRLALRTGWVWF